MKSICPKVKYICKIYGDISLSNSPFIHQLCIKTFNIFCPDSIEKSQVSPSITVAVMFTFSFGSAFATADYNKSLANEYFNVAMNEVKDAETVTISGYAVDYSTLDAHRADLLAAALDSAKKSDDNGKDVYVSTSTQLIALIEADTDLALTIVAAQYDADKAEAVAVLNGISVSDFSTEEMDPECKVDGHTCKTYQDHVKAILADAVDAINEATFTSDSDAGAYVAAKVVIDGYFDAYAGEITYTELLKEKGYVGANGDKIGLGIYEINEDYSDNGTVLGHYTTDYVKGQDAVTAADVAALKAQVAAAYADYLRTKDADKDFAADMQNVLNYLVEEKVIKTTPTDGFGQYFVASYKAKATQAVKDAASLESEAARLAAETDANGALVRDAADVADLVKAGKIALYKDAVGIALDKDESANYSVYVNQIKALYASLDDAKLAYYKKYVETGLNDDLSDAEDDYYAPEYAKYKALVEEYVAKINAAKDNDEVAKLLPKFNADLAKIDDKAAVNGKISTSLYTAAHDYADLVNGQITKDANKYYVDNSYAKLDSEIKKLVGASEARTAKDINALSDQILALVKALPTNSAVEAAQEAADDAVKAIPTKISTADKATIDAAVTAVKAYEDLTAVKDYKATELKTAATKYAYAFNNEMAAKVKAVSETDKAAIKALVAEIEAVEDAYDYAEVKAALAGEKATLNGYLDKIQKTEFDAVKAAITAIPVKENITEAAKDKVVAARGLYDAYVAEYTDYSKAGFVYNVTTDADGFVADDFGQAYTELVAAETLLGLNEVSPAELVKGLKITARSTAKKGSITVKWTVKGEADIDGYEIWKSTKANKGYKKAFTTTKKTYKNSKGLKKGTRYYYKVRAYKVIDGVKVTSDWSNKANRKAK